MEVAELDAFKAIVDYGSVTQAAIRLNHAQSSISFRIKTLESRLGTKLFERSDRGITMTAQGKKLYAYASQILELVSRAQASLSQKKTETRVRLGVIENLTITRQNLLQSIVANPDGMAVDVSIGNTQSLLNDLEAVKLDAVIVGAGFAPAHYRRVTLFNDPLALIYSATQPAIQDLEAFSGQVFLVNSRRSASQRNLDELFLMDNITPKKIIECGSYPLLFSNVINDVGVALVPLSLIDSDQKNLYTLQNAPKPNKPFEQLALIVSPTVGLCQIRAIGVTIKSNSFGNQLQGSFTEMKDALTEVYGKPLVIDALIPGSIWKEPKEWMMSLNRKERYLSTGWSSTSTKPLKNNLSGIEMEARATGSDNGYYLLQYTFNNWSSCEAEEKTKARSSL